MEKLAHEFLAFARELALEGGQRALEIQKNLKQIVKKSMRDVVTEADYMVDSLFTQALEKKYPHHSILAEESGQHQGTSEWTWIIDPIDGTVNFSRGMPLWGINVAIMHHETVMAALIYLPALEEIYTAIKGAGAFLNDHPTHVSATRTLQDFVVSNGDFNVGEVFGMEALNQDNLASYQRQLPAVQRVKCMGSAAVESAWVASGKLDAYIMNCSYPWDIAPGSLLVAEAGGSVSALNGDPLVLAPGARALFSNGKCHEQLVNTLRI
jgi:myo-inositol-1(or 4)-monophosphatase